MNNSQIDSPLVSVAVIAYNSAKTIVETLDSIYNQTYRKIELIISDDGSKDDTVSVCREWVAVHKNRFVRVEIITVPKNTGTSANYNRAANACYGEWIKEIDADDILMPQCVELYVQYVETHPDSVCIFAKVVLFGSDKRNNDRVSDFFDYEFFKWDREKQLDTLLMEHNPIPSGSVFYNRVAVKNLGVRNDERIPLLEDWPKWINLLKAGVHFEFLNIETVKYRVSESSLSTSVNLSHAFLISNALFYQLYRFRYEYEHGSKKQAVENWLRAQNTIKQNMIWHIIFKMYKICIMHKMH